MGGATGVDEQVFLGRVGLVLDSKHRLTVPALYRAQLNAVSGNKVVVVRHVTDPCLVLYPEAGWQAVAHQLSAMPLEYEDWRRSIFSSARPMEMDAASRILLSPETRAMVGIERDVMMVGNGRRLELWDAARFLERDAKTLAEAPPAGIRSLCL